MSKICHKIHQWFSEMKKYSYPFNEQEIPKNGIYILFEKGEFGHSTNRIVRIGTHTRKNNLLSRLKEHFVNENKDKSIFRKNIGRALLNKDKDPFIEQWNKKALPPDSVDFIKQKEIEKRVTKYIRSNISFVVFQIDDKDKNLELESKIISTVSLCIECKPSQNWLGLFSPVEKIGKSGLWLVNKLWKTPLSEDDLIELKNILENAGYSEQRIKLLINKYQGCLLGLAIGDALGAPVEFLRLQEIRKWYGKDGIADFHGWRGFKPGSYTDDTQMSLATAIGCIRAYQKWRERGIYDSTSVVYQCYLEWLESQNDPEQRRGPGRTCLCALQSGKMGTIKEKINNSKGCGGVMRTTTPAGLAFSSDRAFQEGAEYAAITHGHPSGYLTAGFLSGMISYIIEGKTLAEAIDLYIGQLTHYDGHSETLEKIELAQKLSVSQKLPEESIQAIGEGWVGEEALAISLYCSLKFSDNFKSGTLAAVNHSGDSDSTGSITGAILGTLLGVELIPRPWIQKVEGSDRIKKIANDMYSIFKDGKDLSFEEYPPF